MHEPITLHDGAILDGRNRHRACIVAKVEPRFVEWDGRGGTPEGFVMMKNALRRHLSIQERWADFATGDKGGDVVSLAAYLSGTGQTEAARALADMLGVRHV